MGNSTLSKADYNRRLDILLSHKDFLLQAPGKLSKKQSLGICSQCKQTQGQILPGIKPGNGATYMVCQGFHILCIKCLEYRALTGQKEDPLTSSSSYGENWYRMSILVEDELGRLEKRLVWRNRRTGEVKDAAFQVLPGDGKKPAVESGTELTQEDQICGVTCYAKYNRAESRVEIFPHAPCKLPFLGKTVPMYSRNYSRIPSPGDGYRLAEMQELKYLLHARADPNHINDHGVSPLMSAITGRSEDISASLVTLLLDAKADPNLTNSHGVAPLHVAFSTNRSQACYALLSDGADHTLVVLPIHFLCSCARDDWCYL